MTVKPYHSKPKWERAAFEEMKAGWSPARLVEDEKLLREIFSLAKDCPLLVEALEWAEQNGITFFVDRTAVNCAAYYACSTGVIGITEDTIKKNYAPFIVSAIVHEIRHAWQDAQGFIATRPEDSPPEDFGRFFINTALIEGDAYAYGERARLQYRHNVLWEGATPLEVAEVWAQENKYLGEKFQAWFSPFMSFPRIYGDYFSTYLGTQWGVYDGKIPERNFEFVIAQSHRPGIDVDDLQAVLRLGASFSGTKNYLAELPRELLLKKILRPSLANTFWDAALKEQRELTTELRKVHLREKLAHRKRSSQGPQPCP